MMTEADGSVTERWRAPTAGTLRARVIGVAVAGLVFAVGYSHGGYGLPVSGEIALIVAWAVLIGAILGLIPNVRLGGMRLAAVGLLAAFTVWNLTSVIWSDAAGRTVAVGVQLAAVLSVLLAGSLVLRRSDREAVLGGLLGGIALIAVFATGSRLHPQWFPAPTALGPLAAAVRPRLSWPVGYWNALGFLMAMGLPLAIHFATGAVKGVTRALAGAAVPLLSLTLLFAISRSGVAIAAVTVLAAFLLGPLNPRVVVGYVAAIASSAVVVVSALSGSKLMDGITDAGPGVTQARTTLLVLLATSLAMATLTVALHHLPGGKVVARGESQTRPWIRLGIVSALAVLAVGVFFAAGGGPRLNRAWDNFRGTSLNVRSDRVNSVDRLGQLSSNGRWQLWKAAINAGDSAPLIGTGGGTYAIWWTQHRTTGLTVVNAHSQYLEAFADLGAIGLVLFIGFILAMALGCASALRRAGPDLGAAAAGTATVFSFAFSCLGDWGWQVTVVPIVAMLAFSAVAAPEDGLTDEASIPWRLGAGLAAVLVLVLVVPPTVSSHALIDSRSAAAAGRYPDALAAAKSARNWQPYSADAWLQEGLIYEATGNYPQAKVLVRGAIKREPKSWQQWLVLAGLEAKTGNTRGALHDYRRARDLNPTSRLFAISN